MNDYRWGVYLFFKWGFNPVTFLVYVSTSYGDCWARIDAEGYKRRKKHTVFVKQLGTRDAHHMYNSWADYSHDYDAILDELTEAYLKRAGVAHLSDVVTDEPCNLPDGNGQLFIPQLPPTRDDLAIFVSDLLEEEEYIEGEYDEEATEFEVNENDLGVLFLEPFKLEHKKYIDPETGEILLAKHRGKPRL